MENAPSLVIRRYRFQLKINGGIDLNEFVIIDTWYSEYIKILLLLLTDL